MAFSDIMYLMLMAFALLVTMVACNYMLEAMMGHIEGDIPETTNASVHDSWDQNMEFADNSFAAVWFLLAAISIGLTIMLASHPVVLIAWLLFNVLCLFVWDTMNDFLTPFLASDLNLGGMEDAASFVQTDLPKAIIGVNILVGMVLFGKRAVIG